MGDNGITLASADGEEWDAGSVGAGVRLRAVAFGTGRFVAEGYCAALTDRKRLAGRIGTNSVWRLPTEAEWEHACRA